jgi:hypothetical protein
MQRQTRENRDTLIFDLMWSMLGDNSRRPFVAEQVAELA